MSSDPNFHKYCTQVHCPWQCNIHVVSGQHLIRGYFPGQKKKKIIYFVEWNHISNWRIFLKFYLQIHCWWECNIQVSRDILHKEQNHSFTCVIETKYLTDFAQILRQSLRLTTIHKYFHGHTLSGPSGEIIMFLIENTYLTNDLVKILHAYSMH